MKNTGGLLSPVYSSSYLLEQRLLSADPLKSYNIHKPDNDGYFGCFYLEFLIQGPTHYIDILYLAEIIILGKA